MSRIIHMLILGGVVLMLGGCAATTQTGRDFLVFGLDRGSWTMINRQSTGEVGVMEFVPVKDKEKPQNWTRLIGNAFVRLSRIGASEKQDKFKYLKDFFEKRCPGGVTWNIVSNDENGLLYERFSEPCRGQPREHTIGRLLDGKYDRWKLYYSERVSRIPADERRKWIAWLSRARIQTYE